MSDIVEFFRGKSVFITGATGFIGGLVMERLLRVCDVEKVYLLVRKKKGIEAPERLQQIFATLVFDRLRQLKPEFIDKVQLIEGDTSVAGLGMNKIDRALLVEKVNVVFHGAAAMRFNEFIKTATATNVQGTMQIVRLCKEMKQLKAFVHVSTVFSNCVYTDTIEERFYEPPLRAEELIQLCEPEGEELLQKVQENFTVFDGQFNSYIFTKSVAEDTVRRMAKGIPTCIFRPAIIVATKSEPLGGWIDNFYGVAGYMSTVVAGLVRAVHVDSAAPVDAVPADMCVNVLLAAAYKTSNNRTSDNIPIYNFTAQRENALNYKECVELFLNESRNAPSLDALWYPQIVFCKSQLYFTVMSLLLNMIPAVILDLFRTLRLSQPMVVKKMNKLNTFLSMLSYFACRTWTVRNDNLKELWNELSPTDKKLFDFDMNRLDWTEVMTLNYWGSRRYLLKQTDDTIPAARSRMFWLSVADKTLKALVSSSILFMITVFIRKHLFI